jgi:hypothetical protein
MATKELWVYRELGSHCVEPFGGWIAAEEKQIGRPRFSDRVALECEKVTGRSEFPCPACTTILQVVVYGKAMILTNRLSRLEIGQFKVTRMREIRLFEKCRKTGEVGPWVKTVG